jgi:hypothetical protein
MILIILFILLFLLLIFTKENFIRDIPVLNQTIPFIFPNNVIPIFGFDLLKPQLRYTKNMSYDLRGDPIIDPIIDPTIDPIIIPPNEYIWNNPEVIPKFNRDIPNL